MLSLARRMTAAVVTGGLVACAGTTAPSSGQEVARLVEQHWKESGRFVPGDEFSSVERACIVAHSGSADPRTIAAAGEAGWEAQTEAFVAPYADACLSDDHLVHYFQVDMLELDIPAGEAVCKAPVMLRLVREHGFDAIYDDRTTRIAEEVAARTAECEAG